MLKKTLWRAANDDYVDTGYSFAEKRSIAEAYLDNPGFGGANIYRAKIEVDDELVLDLTEKSVGQVAKMLGVQHPGAIGLDEWLPRSPRVLDALREAGSLWVLVAESFPIETTTWIWIGTGADDEPELELWEPTG
jgi:hypothetical protein